MWTLWLISTPKNWLDSFLDCTYTCTVRVQTGSTVLVNLQVHMLYWERGVECVCYWSYSCCRCILAVVCVCVRVYHACVRVCMHVWWTNHFKSCWERQGNNNVHNLPIFRENWLSWHCYQIIYQGSVTGYAESHTCLQIKALQLKHLDRSMST